MRGWERRADALHAEIATYEARPRLVKLPDGLTPREGEVLRLIAVGRTNREISDDLTLSVRTVARHITNIYVKIGARGKADATSYAHRNHLT
jgi:DNA-binding CsgD family transcriptional regulator